MQCSLAQVRWSHFLLFHGAYWSAALERHVSALRGACVVLLIPKEWSFTRNLTICADLLVEGFYLLGGFVFALEIWPVVSRNILCEVCS